MPAGVLTWMAWTTPTKLFFGCIIVMLLLMAVWEKVSPTALRRGFLPMATTRGDRLFIGLITTAFVHIAWLALTEMSVWPVLLGCLLLMIVIGRWG